MPSSTALVLRRVWWHALICVCAADSLAQMEARQRIKTRERHDFLCPCRGGQDRAPSPTGCARSVLRTAIPAGPASSPLRSPSRCYMPVPRRGTEGRTSVMTSSAPAGAGKIVRPLPRVALARSCGRQSLRGLLRRRSEVPPVATCLCPVGAPKDARPQSLARHGADLETGLPARKPCSCLYLGF